MALGFEFRETLSGSYYTLAAPGIEKPMTFSIHAHAKSLGKFTLDPVLNVVGEVDARDFADKRPAHGTLSLHLVGRKIVYEVHFKTNSSDDCRLLGERDVEFLRLKGSLTTLPITMKVGDREVARAVVRFDLRGDLVRYLRSFRFR